MADGKHVKWSLEADYLQGCNCDYGCPCEFEAPPTEGLCEGLRLVLLETLQTFTISRSGVSEAEGGCGSGDIAISTGTKVFIHGPEDAVRGVGRQAFRRGPPAICCGSTLTGG